MEDRLTEQTWEDDLDELDRRLRFADQMGGREGIERQHRNGKLTVRERLPLLVDEGSFEQFGKLRGRATYDETGNLIDVLPDGKVDGIGRIGGRKVVITAGDFTVRGGSGESSHGGLGQELSASERALVWRLPLIRLLDSSGGSVRGFENLGRTYLPDGNSFTHWDVSLLNVAPVVSAVMGAAAGIAALQTTLAHWNVMIRDTSQVFPGGPPVVKASLGADITKEELGGAHIHAYESGVVDNVADSEPDACQQIRSFLSYLPSSVDEMAPRGPATPVEDSRQDEILTIVPRETRRIYNARRLVEQVVDEDSFFPIAPFYGRARITGLARINGFPVGIMANDPRYLGGATDVAAGLKISRLLQLCDTFHLPLVDLADEPGLMVGLQSEKAGIERAGARLISIMCQTRMPWITIAVRRLFGVGGQAHHRPSGMYRRYAWPSASWGSMHIAGGTSAAYRREIEAAPDPDQRRQEIEQRLRTVASPFRTAEATGQDIIDPRDTRAVVADFVEDAQRILATQLGPPPLLYVP
jgi:acetyl-CoA carboxylase carboxyltransferase component